MQGHLITTMFGFIIIMMVGVSSQSMSIECWSDPQILSPNSNAYRAILAIDTNDTVHIAWKDKSNYDNAGYDFDILYRQCSVNGSWTPTEVVSRESENDSDCFFLAVDGNGIAHVVWKEKTNRVPSGGGWDIVYKKRYFNGSWTNMEIVSLESTGNCACPVAQVDTNGVVHVIWPDGTDYINSGDDYDLFYKQRLTNGSWTKAEVITKESTSDCNSPSMVIDDTHTIHVVWEERGTSYGMGDDYDIFYKKRVSYDVWTYPELVSKESTGDSVEPSMDMDVFGTIHVAWVDHTIYKGTRGNYNIFYSQKLVNGTWSVTDVVSKESKRDCNFPCLFVDFIGNVYITWKDETNYNNSGKDADIFYKERFVNDTWTITELVSRESSDDSSFPWMVIDSNRLAHISWWDNIENSGWTVLYKMRLCQDGPLEPMNEDKQDSQEQIIPYVIGIVMILLIVCIILVLKRKRRTI